jgi:hypothetical protein
MTHAILLDRPSDNAVAQAALGGPAYYYMFDSYDMGPQVDVNGNVVNKGVFELHYSLDWTGVTGPGDNPNQLKYGKLAPDNSTVVTWCTYHAATAGMNEVNVLLLSGSAKAVPLNIFIAKGPLGYSE